MGLRAASAAVAVLACMAVLPAGPSCPYIRTTRKLLHLNILSRIVQPASAAPGLWLAVAFAGETSRIARRTLAALNFAGPPRQECFDEARVCQRAKAPGFIELLWWAAAPAVSSLSPVSATSWGAASAPTLP